MASASSAVYAGSTRMPLATPKATISGTGPPAAATAARPASSPACVPPLELACTTDRGRSPAASHWRWSSTNAAANPTAPTGVLPPIGMAKGRLPRARSSSARVSFATSRASQAVTPAKCSSAPKRLDRSWLPAGSAGASPPSTRWTGQPRRAPAAAVMRQWLDWPAPTVISVSAPSACAAPHRSSSFRALLPPMPRPVRSSRLTHSRAPPGSTGPRSSGVGSVASGTRGGAARARSSASRAVTSCSRR